MHGQDTDAAARGQVQLQAQDTTHAVTKLLHPSVRGGKLQKSSPPKGASVLLQCTASQFCLVLFISGQKK